jgi:Rho termination factor, N-terminal domain
MNTSIITPAEITAHLESMTAVELRKLGAANGIKGASKGKKADLVAAIAAIRIAEAEELAAEQAEKELAEQDMTEVAAHKDAVVDEELAKAARRSRRGMVIVAKGTEVHKSETFRKAAEALGYQVEIEYTETGEVDEDDEPIIRHHAVATKGGTVVEGSWIGKAWDYANAGAGIGGKARKVRNLKEALRILNAQA